MSVCFHDKVAKMIGEYHRQYQESLAYSVSNMASKHLGLWSLKQLDLSSVVYQRVCSVIDNLPHSSAAQKQELKEVLQCASQIALPLFVAGMDANPIHHNIQTVENMLLILSYDRIEDHEFLKKAAILALLHDVGSGLVDPTLKKVKSSDIKALEDQLRKEHRPEEEIKQKTQKLRSDARRYREAHMEAGAAVVSELLKPGNMTGGVLFEPSHIKEIADCISKHDNPSIGELLSELGEPIRAEDLVPLDNALAYFLREADRLWMASGEGLEKDLFDELKAAKKTTDTKASASPDPLAKLKYNVGRFKDEFHLYEKAQGIAPSALKQFKNGTLFRSDGAYYLYKCHVTERLRELNCSEWMEELIGEC